MSSVGELRGRLTLAGERAEVALTHLEAARNCLLEAIEAFGAANPNHPELVVPPGFIDAENRIQAMLSALADTNEVLRNYTTQL